MTPTKQDILSALGSATTTVQALPDPPPPPPPPPPPTIVPPLVQWKLGDGADGCSANYWNAGLMLPWKRGVRYGSWLDANGVPEGQAAYAIIDVKALGKVSSSDIAPLVRKWIAKGNTGLLIRGLSGSSAFGSRDDPTLANRPVLRVVTPTGGVINYPCTADSMMGGLSDLPVGVGGPRDNINPGWTLAMQFDLTGLTAAIVASATLELYCEQYVGAHCAVHELDPPTIWTSYEPGDLANKEPGPFAPADIADHDWDPAKFSQTSSGGRYDPNVYTRGYLEFGKDAAGAPLPWSGGSSADMGRYVRVMFSPDKRTAGECMMELARFASDQRKVAPDEVYAQTVVKLESDFPSFSGGKMPPSIAGRYGIQGMSQVDPLAWMAVGANGGGATDGRMHLMTEPVRGDWKSPPNGKVLLGFSVRSVFERGLFPDNPYYADGLIGAVFYVYWADMPRDGFSGYGQNFRWGNVCMRPNLPYAVEAHVRLNTIDLSAPDDLGNGVGRPDGLLEVRVNGVQHTVLDYVDTSTRDHPPLPLQGLRFRHHPDIHCDEVPWDTWYLGGSINAQLIAEGKEHHMQTGRSRASTKPIGP